MAMILVPDAIFKNEKFNNKSMQLVMYVYLCEHRVEINKVRISQKEFAEALQCDTDYIVKLANQLENMGLITRVYELGERNRRLPTCYIINDFRLGQDDIVKKS